MVRRTLLVLALLVLAAAFRPLAPRARSVRLQCEQKFKNFDDMLANIETPVLVDFFAQWCGPCVMMQPVLEEVAARLDKEAKVAKVDTDKSPRLGSRYQVEALPTLVLFFKGQEVERFIGYRSADELEKEVRVALKKISK